MVKKKNAKNILMYQKICIIKEDAFNELKDKYKFSKEHDDKGKDDFEIEI